MVLLKKKEKQRGVQVEEREREGVYRQNENS